MATQLRHHDPLQEAIERETEALFEKGYVILRDVADRRMIAALDEDFREPFAKTPPSRGNFFGEKTVRFGRALIRSRHSASLVQDPLVLGIAERALAPWCESIQLNLTQAIAVHPGAPQQLPHRDQDMWPGPKGEMEYMVNVIWPLTRFTRENGATMVWGNSHKEEKDRYIADDDTIAAEMEPGSCLIFLGSTLHGQGANESDEIRRALVVGYSLSWLRSYENQMLSYPPHIARRFPPGLADLVGYRQVPPNLNNFEGQSPTVLLQDDIPEHFGAVDNFRPDQVEAIDYYFQHRKPRIVR
jgi:ectoine hydroxylase-related dioxygenase (phytanoyl-CoA dioxygenase family)